MSMPGKFIWLFSIQTLAECNSSFIQFSISIIYRMKNQWLGQMAANNATSDLKLINLGSYTQCLSILLGIKLLKGGAKNILIHTTGHDIQSHKNLHMQRKKTKEIRMANDQAKNHYLNSEMRKSDVYNQVITIDVRCT